MKISSAFLRAAKRVARGRDSARDEASYVDHDYSCHALDDELRLNAKVSDADYRAAVGAFYHSICGPDEIGLEEAWFGDTTATCSDPAGIETYIQNQDARVFALLLTRQVVLEMEADKSLCSAIDALTK